METALWRVQVFGAGVALLLCLLLLKELGPYAHCLVNQL